MGKHFTIRMSCWLGIIGCLLFAVSPMGCSDDGIGDLLASGAIGSPGGSVRAANGAALIIPEFTLNAVYRFELLEIEVKAPANHDRLSLLIEVKPDDIKFNASIPASLILPLDRSRLPANRSIWQIKAFMYDGTNWKSIPGVIDDGNSTITIPISQTGTYGAFLGPAPPAPEPEPEIPTNKENTGESTADGTAEKQTELPMEKAAEPTTEPIRDAGSNEPTPDAASGETTPETNPEPTTEPAPDAGVTREASEPATETTSMESTKETNQSG